MSSSTIVLSATKYEMLKMLADPEDFHQVSRLPFKFYACTVPLPLSHKWLIFTGSSGTKDFLLGANSVPGSGVLLDLLENFYRQNNLTSTVRAGIL